MPTGPKGEKRKADVIGNAVLIARIAVGEVANSMRQLRALASDARHLSRR